MLTPAARRGPITRGEEEPWERHLAELVVW